MNANQVLELIYQALGMSRDSRIMHVSIGNGVDRQAQISIVTEDDIVGLQTWVLDENSILVSENEKPSKLYTIYCQTGCSCCSGENHYLGFFSSEQETERIAGEYRKGIGNPLASQYAPYGIYEVNSWDVEYLPNGRFIVNEQVFPIRTLEHYDRIPLSF